MELCDIYLQKLFLIDPTINDFFCKTEWGHKRHIQPNVYSEPYYEKLYKLVQAFLKRVKKKKEKTLYDTLLLKDLLYSIHMEKDYEIYMYMPIDLHNNILITYVTYSSGNGSYAFSDKDSYSDFSKRLKSLPDITDTIIEKLNNGIDNNVLLYSGVVKAMSQQIKDILYNKSYKHTKRTKYSKQLNKDIDLYLVTCLNTLLLYLLNDYKSQDSFGLQSYKGGKKAYREIIKHAISSSSKPEEIQRYGYSELRRISQKMKGLQTKIKDVHYDTEKDVIDDLNKIQTMLKKQVAPLFKQPLTTYKIKPVPPENKHMYAYYSLTTKTFYINTHNLENIKKHELLVLSLHEGNPGHHFQTQLHQKSNVPEYTKLGNTLFIEGWAFYCENLFPYQDSMEYYHKLRYDLNRTLRLLIDTGIHYFGWSYTKCFQLLQKHMKTSDKETNRMLLRYICLPGQALTYKLGGNKILQLREDFKQKGYSTKEFHTFLMEKGPISLDELTGYLTETYLS